MESPLIHQIAAAAERVGAMLIARPIPAAATTMAEFRAAFTPMDDAASALLRQDLGAIRPGVPWAEDAAMAEAGTASGDDVGSSTGSSMDAAASTYWLVDATDGAVQYLQGLPQWCVSVTLVERGVATAVVIHNPVLGETYTAELGAGAWRAGSPITPSRKTELAASIAATSHPPFITNQPEAIPAAGAALSAMLGSVGAIRNLGPTSWQVADTAAGRIDVFWEFGEDAENLVGAALIAREAGAVVTDAAGLPWTPRSGSIVVASPLLHADVLRALSAVPVS